MSTTDAPESAPPPTYDVVTTFDVVGAIMAFEEGTLSEDDTIVLFQHLVDTGLAWSLQGAYGRMAAQMLADEVIS